MEPEAPVREVLADDRHLEVRCGTSAELLRQRQPQPAGRVGASEHLSEQFLPLLAGHAVVLEVGAGPLTPVVEEPHVVVLLLERDDLGFDERVEVVERRLDLGWDGEVHRRNLGGRHGPMTSGGSSPVHCGRAGTRSRAAGHGRRRGHHRFSW